MGDDKRVELPTSWPAELSTRIQIAIHDYVREGNVGLAASVAAQIAAGYYACPTSPGNEEFLRDLASAVNRQSRENASNTPDFILAEFMSAALVAFENASRHREHWYGKGLRIGATPLDSECMGLWREMYDILASHVGHVSTRRLLPIMDKLNEKLHFKE